MSCSSLKWSWSLLHLFFTIAGSLTVGSYGIEPMALHLVGKLSTTVGFEPMALYLVGKLSATKPPTQLLFFSLFCSRVSLSCPGGP